MAKKNTTSTPAQTAAAPLPDDLDIGDLWVEFATRFRKVRWSGESLDHVLDGFVYENDIDTEVQVLNGIDSEGWLDEFREYLDGVLASAAARPEPKALPRGKSAGELVALYQTQTGEPGNCRPVFEFLDARPDSGVGLLTKMIDEAGLTGRFRSFLNKRLAKVA